MQPILVLEMKQLKRKMTNLSNLNNWIYFQMKRTKIH